MTEYISFQETGFFSKTAMDYMSKAEALRPFYQYEVSLDGVKKSIEARKSFSQERNVLADTLLAQYTSLQISGAVLQNIESLRQENTFTITTAHQPNIFTGPLYFLYKIAHVIQLSQWLKTQFPGDNFVPVYYMGSEDADLDEIGQFTVQGKKYIWQTKQTGAVGRMLVDAPLLHLLEDLKGQIDVQSEGKNLTALFAQHYTLGKSIQQATLEIVHALFGNYGLVVLIPDNAALKKLFEPVIVKELTSGFSHKIVEKTAQSLTAAGYKPQASGRELNLFYLLDDHRERIEKEGEKFLVRELQLEFSETEILDELRNHPERFSGNVILRGAFQETVLPNILFVGGGGELAYWLELKNVFAAVNVPYPMLLLRNSFLLFSPAQAKQFRSLDISAATFFRREIEILNLLVERKKGHPISLSAELQSVEKIFHTIIAKATESDLSLQDHAKSLLANAQKRILALEKKMQRAERQKLCVELERIESLKQQLFPGNNLQERVENVATYYPLCGSRLIAQIISASPALDAQFVLLFL